MQWPKFTIKWTQILRVWVFYAKREYDLCTIYHTGDPTKARFGRKVNLINRNIGITNTGRIFLMIKQYYRTQWTSILFSKGFFFSRIVYLYFYHLYCFIIFPYGPQYFVTSRGKKNAQKIQRNKCVKNVCSMLTLMQRGKTLCQERVSEGKKKTIRHYIMGLQ